jgi:hypothetical protein
MPLTLAMLPSSPPRRCQLVGSRALGRSVMAHGGRARLWRLTQPQPSVGRHPTQNSATMCFGGESTTARVSGFRGATWMSHDRISSIGGRR